jgi:hypothetical protein
MEPHALKTPVLGPGEPRRPLSPSQRTRMRARCSRPSRALLTTRRRPAALKTPVLGPGEPRRPLSPSQRTRMRARRSRPSRAPLTTRRRPAALKTPVLGPGEPRRPLSPSQRPRMRARCSRSADLVPLARGRALHSLRTRCCSRSCPVLPSPRRRCPERDRASAPRRRPSRSAAASSGLKTRVWFLLSLSWTAGSRSRSPSLSTAERSGGSAWCLTRSLAAGSSWPRARLSPRTTPPTAVAVSTHADAGPPPQAEPRPADYPPSSSRPEDTCPRAGRAAPIAVAVSTHADAGRLLQAALSRTLLSTPAVVPPPWRRLSSGRATRADHCRRPAARCCGPAAPD